VQLQPDQVAVVTGAASGIGLALAHACARRGLRVVLADVEVTALEAAAARLAEGGAEVAAVPTDVSEPGSVDELASATLERFGGVDLVANNAGVGGGGGPMWEVGPNDWSWTLGVNLTGVANGIRAFVPHLVAQGRGHVLNTASLAGLIAPPYMGPYVASKFAVVGMSEALAAELEQVAPGVGVTVLCPGYVATNIFSSERNRPDHLASERAAARLAPEARDAMVADILDRAMDPAEAAELALAGVEAGRLHVLTHADTHGLVADRLQRLLGGIG
jgi:NAD(P)-dependent dehydrogenase (short-subunit alcohol dehydrogenase family)